ncbi:MAG: DUF4386 family protein [Anaerolineales bacterium]
MPKTDKDAVIEKGNWKNLYRIGALAPILTLIFYISEFALIPWDAYPTSPEEWFRLIQRSKLLGLFYLNALDIFSITLLGLMFLALFMTLRKTDQASMLMATFFGLLGVGVFVVPRVAMLSLLNLSDQYALAASEAEQARLLAAGETLGALGTPTPQTMGFFFMSIGVLILSVIMLQNPPFSKITAWFGILASLATFADELSLVLFPNLSTTLMILSGLFWIPWWLLISRELFRQSRSANFSPSR